MNRSLALALAAALSSLAAVSAAQTPQTFAFSYQGRLSEAGIPVDGSRSMVFRLFDAEVGGTEEGALGFADVAVEDGLFVVELDYGAGTALGQQLWLDLSSLY